MEFTIDELTLMYQALATHLDVMRQQKEAIHDLKNKIDVAIADLRQNK